MQDEQSERTILECQEFIDDLLCFNPFGEEVNRLCRRARMSHSELAQALGKSTGAVDSWCVVGPNMRLPRLIHLVELKPALCMTDAQFRRLIAALNATRHIREIAETCQALFTDGDYDTIQQFRSLVKSKSKSNVISRFGDEL